MQTKELTKGALLAALTAIFALTFIYLPLFSVFGMFLGVCTVVVLVTHIRSFKVSATALAVALILIALLSNLQNMIFSGLLMIVFPGMVLGLCFRHKSSMGTLVIGGGISYLVAVIATVWCSKWLYGFDFVQELQTAMEQAVQTFVSAVESVPELANGEGADQLLSTLPSLVQQSILMIPSALITASGFLALCSILLTRSVLNKLYPGQFSYLPTFSQLHLPRAFAFGYIVLMIAGIMSASNSSLYFLICNATTVVSAVLLVSGISMVKYLINKIQAPQGVSLLILLLLLPFAVLLSQPLSFLGMLDSLWDFRNKSSLS